MNISQSLIDEAGAVAAWQEQKEADRMKQIGQERTEIDWRPNLRDESKPYPEYGWVRDVTYSPWRKATHDEAAAQGVLEHDETCQIRTGWSSIGPFCTCGAEYAV